MKYLFDEWDKLEKRLGHDRIYLFLDCDGTLAPIADTPDKASIPEKTKEVLSALSRSARLKLAIISGRSLSDIKGVVGLNGIIYVGNHGLEIDGPGIASDWKPAESYKDILSKIKTQLSKEIAGMPGIFVEDKGLSLCLHYRMAGVDEEKVKAIFHNITDPYKASGKIATMDGKKVIEIRPAVGWDKGKVVKWLLARDRLLVQDENSIAIYVGDDRTDEEAFKALGNSEISVMVGNVPASPARYYVDNTEEVYRFLTMILNTRSG